MVVQIEI